MADVDVFNHCPENCREITPEQFAQSMFFMYDGEVTYRQLSPNSEIEWLGEQPRAYFSCRVYKYHDDTHVLIAAINGEPRYFEAGCNHDYRDLDLQECRERGVNHYGMCWHVIECTKCGVIQSYDSSD